MLIIEGGGLSLAFVNLALALTLSLPVANKRHLGSAPKPHFFPMTGNTEAIGLSDLMTLFIDLGCLYCKQTQRAFNVFKNTLN
jgi:hypothetical protein